MKPAQLRPLAEQDLVERTRYFVTTEGAALGDRFFAEAIAAIRSVEAMPGIGSPRVGELIGVEGLRRVGVTGFPWGRSRVGVAGAYWDSRRAIERPGPPIGQ